MNTSTSSPPRGEVASNAGGEPTPGWLWIALLAGAVLTLWWGWFVFGFIQEPSAVGRVLIALLTLTGTSVVSGLVGAAGAYGLIRDAVWARPVAWIAAIAITLTIVGAIAGIPALVGLWWSRNTRRP